MNSKLKLIIIFGGGLLLAVCILGVASLFIKRTTPITSNNANTQNVPTITPYTTTNTAASTNPTNNQINVPVNQPITITFSPSTDLSNVTIATNPQFSFTQSVSENVLTITPNQPLQPGVTYKVVAKGSTNNQPDIASTTFTVQGPTVTPNNSFNSHGIAQQEEQSDLKNQPDIFLYNQSPYTGSDFSITANIGSNGFPQFVVGLTGSDKNTSKNDFISWAESLGLTSDQINSLNITYQ